MHAERRSELIRNCKLSYFQPVTMLDVPVHDQYAVVEGTICEE